MTDWYKSLAATVNAHEQAKVEKRDRVKLLRELAGTEGQQLWQQVRTAVKESTDGFNGDLTPNHPLRIAIASSDVNNLELRAGARVVLVEAYFDSEGRSFLEYRADTSDAARSAVGKRITFELSDTHALTFVAALKGEQVVLSPSDVAQIIVTSLFPFAGEATTAAHP